MSGRRATPDFVGRDDGASSHHSPGSDHAATFNSRSFHQRGPHADQSFIFNCASLERSLVANGDPRANRGVLVVTADGGSSRANDSAILNVGLLSNANLSTVAWEEERCIVNRWGL